MTKLKFVLNLFNIIFLFSFLELYCAKKHEHEKGRKVSLSSFEGRKTRSQSKKNKEEKESNDSEHYAADGHTELENELDGKPRKIKRRRIDPAKTESLTTSSTSDNSTASGRSGASESSSSISDLQEEKKSEELSAQRILDILLGDESCESFAQDDENKDKDNKLMPIPIPQSPFVDPFKGLTNQEILEKMREYSKLYMKEIEEKPKLSSDSEPEGNDNEEDKDNKERKEKYKKVKKTLVRKRYKPVINEKTIKLIDLLHAIRSEKDISKYLPEIQDLIEGGADVEQIYLKKLIPKQAINKPIFNEIFRKFKEKQTVSKEKEDKESIDLSNTSQIAAILLHLKNDKNKKSDCSSKSPHRSLVESKQKQVLEISPEEKERNDQAIKNAQLLERYVGTNGITVKYYKIKDGKASAVRKGENLNGYTVVKTLYKRHKKNRCECLGYFLGSNRLKHLETHNPEPGLEYDKCTDCKVARYFLKNSAYKRHPHYSKKTRVDNNEYKNSLDKAEKEYEDELKKLIEREKDDKKSSMGIFTLKPVPSSSESKKNASCAPKKVAAQVIDLTSENETNPSSKGSSTISEIASPRVLDNFESKSIDLEKKEEKISQSARNEQAIKNAQLLPWYELKTFGFIQYYKIKNGVVDTIAVKGEDLTDCTLIKIATLPKCELSMCECSFCFSSYDIRELKKHLRSHELPKFRTSYKCEECNPIRYFYFIEEHKNHIVDRVQPNEKDIGQLNLLFEEYTKSISKLSEISNSSSITPPTKIKNLDRLLNSDQQVIDRSTIYTRALFRAFKGSISGFKKLLNSGADINAINDNSESLFIYASKKQYDPHIVRALYENGARNVNHRDIEGNTAFLWAAKNRDLDMMVELYKIGADVNIKNNKGENHYFYLNEEELRCFEEKLNVWRLSLFNSSSSSSSSFSSVDLPDCAPQNDLNDCAPDMNYGKSTIIANLGKRTTLSPELAPGFKVIVASGIPSAKDTRVVVKERKERKEEKVEVPETNIKLLVEELIKLINDKNIDKINSFLSKHEKIKKQIIECCDDKGLTPYVHAFRVGNKEIFDILKQFEVDLAGGKYIFERGKFLILQGNADLNDINYICDFNVLLQSSIESVQGIHGSTCGIHAMKNALLSILQLIAASQDDIDYYGKMQQSLTTRSLSLNLTGVDNLTSETQIIFRNIYRLLKLYRETLIRKNVAVNENTTTVEEISYLINNINAIMADTKIEYDMSKTVTAVGYSIDSQDILLNFNDAINFAHQKALAKRNPYYCHAFVLAVKTDKSLPNPNHWICLLVLKDRNNNLIYAQMDSLGNKDYPEVKQFKNAFESSDDLFKNALDLLNIYKKNNITDNKLLKMNPEDLQYWLPSKYRREYNNFIQSFINAFSDLIRLEELSKLIESKDFNFNKIISELKLDFEKFLTIFRYSEKKIKEITDLINEKIIGEFVNTLKGTKAVEPLIKEIKDELKNPENASVVEEMIFHNLDIDILLDNIDRAIDTESNENLLMLVIKKGTLKLLDLLLKYGANPYSETRSNKQTKERVYSELLPFEIAEEVGGPNKRAKLEMLLKYAIAFVEDKIHFRKNNQITNVGDIFTTRKTEASMETDIVSVFRLAAQNGIYKLLRMLLAFDESLTKLCDTVLPLVPLDSIDRDKIIKLFTQAKNKLEKRNKESKATISHITIPIKKIESKEKANPAKKLDLKGRSFSQKNSIGWTGIIDSSISSLSGQSSIPLTTSCSSNGISIASSSSASSIELSLLPTPQISSAVSNVAATSIALPSNSCSMIANEEKSSAMDISVNEHIPILTAPNGQKIEMPREPY